MADPVSVTTVQQHIARVHEHHAHHRRRHHELAQATVPPPAPTPVASPETT